MATNTQKGITALQQKQAERLKNQYSGNYIKNALAKPATITTPINSTPQKANVPLASPVSTQQTSPDFTTTVQERANALVQKQAYDDPRQFAEEIGFSKEDIPSSLEAQVQRLKEQQAQRLKQTEDQIALTNRIEAGNVAQARRAGEGAIAASDVSLIAGREAPTSASNIRVASAFEKETNRRVNDLADQANAARAERETALQDLKLAQQEQRADLILNAKNRLANAETEIKRIDTDLLNAQQAQSQEARAIQEAARANFNSFTGVIDSGIQLDTSGVRNLATSLNIPFELALDYYDGAKSIRDEKSLNQEEKNLALQDLRIDLDRKKKGLDDVKARQIDYLSNLRKSGANQADISAYKELVGITDYDDPLTKIDLETKQLEAKIKQNQLNGIPTSIAEQEALFVLRQKQKDLSGEGITAYIPAPSQRSASKGINVTIQNGLYDISAPANYQAWCGEFVNDVWGVGVFGDKYSDKQSQVSKNGILSKEIKDPFSEIVPGMAFVMPIYDKNGKLHANGHTGIVTGVSPDGLSVYTRETNADGSYKGSPTGSGTNITNQIRSIQSIYGFVRPPKATLAEPSLAGGNGTNIIAESLLTDLGGTENERRKLIKNITDRVNSGQAKNVAEAKKQLGIITKTDLELQKTAKEEIKPARDQYNEINLKLQAIPNFVNNPNAIGDVATVVNFLKTIDPSSVARETEVAGVENARGAIASIGNYFNKIQTGEKLTKKQRQEIKNTAGILDRVAADSYYKQLLERKAFFETRGVEPTFVTGSEIQSLERKLGAKRVNSIKAELNLISPNEIEMQNDPLGILSTKPKSDPLGLFND